MKLIINEKYYTDTPSKSYQGTEIFELIAMYFQFRLFTDCGEWFLYIHLGKRWYRFSSAGFLKGKLR